MGSIPAACCSAVIVVDSFVSTAPLCWSGVVFVCASSAAMFASGVVVVLLGALFAPRFFLEACCPEVVVFPGVSSPKGRWGGVDDAALASRCQTEVARRWAIRLNTVDNAVRPMKTDNVQGLYAYL